MSLFNELPIHHTLINKEELINLASMDDQSQENSNNEKITGIFYEIFSAKGELAGHLLGTVHFASRDMLELNFAIRNAIKRSNQIYLEITDDMPTANEEVNNNEDVNNVEELLSTEENEKLQIYVDTAFRVIINELHAYGASITFITAQADQFWLSSLRLKLEIINKLKYQLSVIYANTALIKDPENPYIKHKLGIEEILSLHATNYDKQLNGLESNSKTREALIQEVETPTLRNRIARLPNPSEVTEDFILQELNVLKKTNQFWKQGNEAGFISTWKPAYARLNEKLYKALFNDRDKVMANKIDDVLQANKCDMGKEEEITDLPFFAVGASHLIRKDSNIIQLLQEKGWFVQRS